MKLNLISIFLRCVYFHQYVGTYFIARCYDNFGTVRILGFGILIVDPLFSWPLAAELSNNQHRSFLKPYRIIIINNGTSFLEKLKVLLNSQTLTWEGHTFCCTNWINICGRNVVGSVSLDKPNKPHVFFYGYIVRKPLVTWLELEKILARA